MLNSDQLECEARGMRYHAPVYSYKNRVLAKTAYSFPDSLESIDKEWWSRLLEKPKGLHTNQWEANTFIREFENNNHPLQIEDFLSTAVDSDIVSFADSKADLCHDRIEVGNLNGAINEALVYGFEIPMNKDSKHDVSFERLACCSWWRRQFRKLARQTVDQKSRADGLVRRYKEVYCGNFMLKRRAQQKARNSDTLRKLEAENQDGFKATLEELSMKGVSNPKVRRAELMTRIKGFEAIAQEMEHEGHFITWTAPGEFHPVSAKYNGASPKETQDILLNQWAKCRAKLGRQGLDIYGIRVVEPHHDGTPHWHMMLFLEPEQSKKVLSIMNSYALQILPDEKGAKEHRFTSKYMDPKLGTASGYIAKYICKNIDGTYQSSKGENYSFKDFEAGNLDSIVSARKVEAWASGWNIRQFQQLGGAPVTVWRELRRVNETDLKNHSAHMKIAYAAADNGEWDLFLKAMGGINQKRCNLKIRTDLQEGDKPNKYGETSAKIIKGLVDAVTGSKLLTRLNVWVIRMVTGSLLNPSQIKGHEKELTEIENAEAKSAFDFFALLRPPPAGVLDLCQ